MTVCLSPPGQKRRYVKIHRLVLLAFKGPSDLMVNHINHQRDDNRLENLEYCTALENVRHCVRAGRNSKPPPTVGKVPDETVRAIRTSKESYRVLMKRFDMSQTHVYEIRNRKRYGHVND